MANYLRVRADARNGRCWLFLIGDLDLITADRLADFAGALLDAVPGPVVVDLSGLTFIDERGARTLAAMIQALSAQRRPVIHGCPPHVRFVLDMLGLSLGYRQADYRPTDQRSTARSATHDLVVLLRDARLHATQTRLQATWVLARLTGTGIRVANTRERTDLIREQGQRTLALIRGSRDRVSDVP